MPKKGQTVSEETRLKMKAARARHKPHIVGRYGLTLQKVESELAAGRIWCSDCKQFHDRDAFGNGQRLTRCKAACAKRNRDHYSKNSAKRNAGRAEYFRANIATERIKAKDRNFGKYGANRAWYDATLEAQGGGCAICGKTEPHGERKYFSIDHRHGCCPSKTACNKCRRGLLCDRCNMSLERVEAVPDWTQRALAYLAQYA